MSGQSYGEGCASRIVGRLLIFGLCAGGAALVRAFGGSSTNPPPVQPRPTQRVAVAAPTIRPDPARTDCRVAEVDAFFEQSVGIMEDSEADLDAFDRWLNDPNAPYSDMAPLAERAHGFYLRVQRVSHPPCLTQIATQQERYFYLVWQSYAALSVGDLDRAEPMMSEIVTLTGYLAEDHRPEIEAKLDP